MSDERRGARLGARDAGDGDEGVGGGGGGGGNGSPQDTRMSRKRAIYLMTDGPRSPERSSRRLGAAGSPSSGPTGAAAAGAASPSGASLAAASSALAGAASDSRPTTTTASASQPLGIDTDKLPGGTEGARVAAEYAINSVSWAMRQVQEEHGSKQHEIATLRREKATLETRLAETRQALKQTEHELKTTQLSLKDYADRNEGLFRNLASEQAAFQKLKDECMALQAQLTELREANSKLLERQVSEKNVRDELATELAAMQQEINQLELEKSRFHHRCAELEMKRRIETEAFEQDRAQWKDKQLKFLQKIQEEEVAVRAANDLNEALRREIGELRERNGYLEHQLKGNERKIKELQHEFDVSRDEMRKMRELHQTANNKNADLRNALEAAKEEQKKVEEQSRAMAEKVFQLMNELQTLDEWKQKTSAELLEKERTAIMYQRRHELLNKQHEEAVAREVKLVATEAKLRERLNAQTQLNHEMQIKLANAQRARKSLSLNMKGTMRNMGEVENRANRLSSLLTEARNELGARSAEARQLEGELRAAMARERQLKQSIAAMDRERQELLNKQKKKDRDLELWRHKDRLFQRLKGAVAAQDGRVGEMLQSLEAFEVALQGELQMEADTDDALQRASSAPQQLIEQQQQQQQQGDGEAVTGGDAASGGKRRGGKMRRSRSVPPRPTVLAIPSKARNAYAEERGFRMHLRKLLRSHAGKRVQGTLQHLKIEEASVLQWVSDPGAFFRGLDDLVARMEDWENNRRPATLKDQEIKLLQDKNRRLVAQLERSEECKAKAVLRLSSVLARLSTAGNGQGAMAAASAANEAAVIAMSSVTASVGGGSGGGSLVGRPSGNEGGESDNEDGAGGESRGANGEAKAVTNTAKRTTEAALRILQENTNLSLLQLSDNGIDDAEASYVAEAIRENRVLHELDMRQNQIGQDGLMALVLSVLTESCAIETLDLRYNQVRVSGLELLVSFLRSSQGLAGLVAASLAEERERSQIVPFVYLRTTTRTVGVDLRHNPLFAPEVSAVERREALNNIASQLASLGQQGPMETLYVTSDVEEKRLSPEDARRERVSVLMGKNDVTRTLRGRGSAWANAGENGNETKAAQAESKDAAATAAATAPSGAAGGTVDHNSLVMGRAGQVFTTMWDSRRSRPRANPASLAASHSEAALAHASRELPRFAMPRKPPPTTAWDSGDAAAAAKAASSKGGALNSKATVERFAAALRGSSSTSALHSALTSGGGGGGGGGGLARLPSVKNLRLASPVARRLPPLQ